MDSSQEGTKNGSSIVKRWSTPFIIGGKRQIKKRAMTKFWKAVRRKWQPTPVFLPGESHGRRSLVGYSPRVTESDTTQRLLFHFQVSYVCFLGLAQMVNNLPATQETWVQFLGLEYPWRREEQSFPVFLPGEFHGQKSLVSYSA